VTNNGAGMPDFGMRKEGWHAAAWLPVALPTPSHTISYCFHKRFKVERFIYLYCLQWQKTAWLKPKGLIDINSYIVHRNCHFVSYYAVPYQARKAA
jgi:hypothetical protein